MSKGQSLTVKLSLAAVFAALVTVSTLILQIPVPSTGGYINVGDAMIFTSALLFGPIVGGWQEELALRPQTLSVILYLRHILL